ncbi:MAG TPA: sigma-54 dependent transcriptional regulator [Myxococcota bacterium]
MTIKGRVFVLDDDELIASMLERSLKKEGYDVRSETTTEDILNKISSWCPDLVLLDIHLDENRTGLDILEDMKREAIPGEVVMLTADGSAESAITAMKLGAADYLTKPFNMAEVQLVIKKVIEKERLREEVDYLRKARTAGMEAEMIGESPAMVELRDKAEKLAEAQVQIVLITGESGTGKEVMARYIHNRLRRDRGDEYIPLIAVNCTALPENLFESELFGHVKGAFTDAKSDKKGMFELANGGTILLDEIGDMEHNLQSKLLRVLEDRAVRRLGGKTDLPIDVSVIVTTNTRLDEAVNAGRFRTDLFYRLNTFPLHIPPLRERKQDIPPLARHFLEVFAKKYMKKAIRGFSPEAEEILCSHDWKGNCRELRNVIERIVVLENVETILPEHLPMSLTNREFVERRKSTRYMLPPDGVCLEDLEKDLIDQALKRADYNQTKAAKLLGVSYDSLRYRIKKFELA